MNNGWVKVHRRMIEHWMMGDHGSMVVWLYLLLNATHKPRRVQFDGRLIDLKPGQLTCGCRQIADATGVSESKAYRALKCFESEKQIEIQTSNRCSLVSITNWSEYQQGEAPNETPVKGQRNSGETLVKTKQECKNVIIEEGGAPFVEPSIATGVPTLEQVMESVFKRIPEFFPEHHEAGRAEIKAAEFRRAIRNAYNEMNCSADAYGRWRWGNRPVVDWRNPIRTKLNEADAEMMKAFRARRGQPI